MKENQRNSQKENKRLWWCVMQVHTRHSSCQTKKIYHQGVSVVRFKTDDELT